MHISSRISKLILPKHLGVAGWSRHVFNKKLTCRQDRDLPQRVQIAVVAAEVNHAAGDRRRRKDRSYALHSGNASDEVVIETGAEDSFIVGTPIRLGKGRELLPGGVGLELPGACLSFEVDRGEPAVMRANVERVAGDGGRGKERKVKLERKDLSS
jgi:hypothetical protein